MAKTNAWASILKISQEFQIDAVNCRSLNLKAFIWKIEFKLSNDWWQLFELFINLNIVTLFSNYKIVCFQTIWYTPCHSIKVHLGVKCVICIKLQFSWHGLRKSVQDSHLSLNNFEIMVRIERKTFIYNNTR